MKKTLTISLLLLLPFLATAQNEPTVLKDFYKASRNIPSSFALNDHVNIIQANPDNETFDVMAVNDQMQTLWKTSLKGYVHTVVKFKDKVLAIASTDFSSAKRYNNTFTGFLLDPSTGKVLIEKILFDGQQDFFTTPFIFTGEGKFLKIAIRQTNVERRIHVSLPGIFSIASFNSYYKQYHQTKAIDVIDFNEKLEPIYKFKPIVPDEPFLGMACNNQGDLFVNWFNKGNVEFEKYDSGKDKPLKQMTASIVMANDDILKNMDENLIFLTPSKKNNNVLYYSLAFKNPDKERELGIGKIDFATGKKDYVNEIFVKAHVKELKKSFVPINKKLDSPDLGAVSNLEVRKLMEIDDHLIVTLSSLSASSSTIVSGGTWISESTIMLNDYDTNLHLNHQQLIPAEYSVPYRTLPTGYYHLNNKLYIFTNDKHGMTTLNALVCIYDLSNSKCESMNWLPKKKIGNSETAASSSVMWFKNSYIMPYLDVRSMSGKYDVTLQQNLY
jgi:hypothetical protein